MKMLLDKDLLYEILSVVEEIPEGCISFTDRLRDL